ncbi:unnamed protein product [Microthlaspi erraticum]|uniref:RRM domain-containing protein n=1 Tax=Microthlaspi erraticum TaxID=1685480 RepID=A0A6D2JDD0_9BRAS|nr:unnamed protein product [Microthlaspi erraticum]
MAEDLETPYHPDPDDLRRIPVDLFVSKKFPDLSAGDLGFADSSDHLLFILRKSSSTLKSLLHSSGAPLFSISRLHNGMWELHKGDVENRKELVLTVKRTANRFSKIELEVSFTGESSQHLVIKGCPFQKSCTIYSQDSIVAQTSLMYKLRQIYVGRSKFRLTIFPESVDHSLVVAMIIQYAKAKSDCIAKAEGTFVPKDKKRKQEEKVERKREEAQRPNTANGPTYQNGNPAPPPFQPNGEEAMPPNNILFIQNLPYETTSTMLQLLFVQYPGFKEIRMISAKPGIAFVEYEDEVQSSMAMQALQGFKITPQNPMVISFAKK